MSPWLAHALPDADDRDAALAKHCDCCGGTACACGAGYCLDGASDDGKRVPCPVHCLCRTCKTVRGDRIPGKARW